MNKKDKNFYVWTMAECIKSTYEEWGIDMTSMYDYIKKSFPNVITAINKIYNDLKEPNFYGAKSLIFNNPKYVYEAISNLIPQHKTLHFDIRTKQLSNKFGDLKVYPWNRFVLIERIDLVLAVLLFTEEFILQPVSCKNVILTDSKITIYGNFVTLKVSKHEDLTYISIRVKNVVLLEYLVQN